MDTIKNAATYVTESIQEKTGLGKHEEEGPSRAEISAFVAAQKPLAADRRDLTSRIFVNRHLRLDKIEWVGFDMDYTLAQFKSPEFESMMYDLLIKSFVEAGYPDVLLSWKYDPHFAIRSIYFDKETGNLLKIDCFNRILKAYFGKRELKREDILKEYSSMTLPAHDAGQRYHPMPKLFQLAEACLYSDLIEYYFNYPKPIGPKPTLTNIFNDMASALNHVHGDSILKDTCVEQKEKFIVKKKETAILLDRLVKSHVKPFLMTNSNYSYVEKVMTYMLDGQLPEYKSWRDYFELIIVSSGKPEFFADGKELRELNRDGLALPGTVEKFEKGKIYQGGSVELFYKLTGVKNGDAVLYAGDSINTDVAKSSKLEAWRTFLIVPELENELPVWEKNRELVSQMRKLNELKMHAFLSQDANEEGLPENVENIIKHRRAAFALLDAQFGTKFGSIFAAGLRNTEFALKARLHADIYSGSYLNLLNYPTTHQFRAEYDVVPHLV